MSASELIHKAIVQRGQLLFKRPKLIKKLFDGLEGKDVNVTIEEHIRSKSLSQLGFFYGGIIRKSCMKANIFAGWEFDEIVDFFCRKYLSYKKEIIIIQDGIEHRSIENVTQRLSKLDVEEMTIFIEKVIMFCSRVEIEILDPSEYNLTKYSSRKKSN